MSPFLAARNTPEAIAATIARRREQDAREQAADAEEAVAVAARLEACRNRRPTTAAEQKAFNDGLQAAADKYGANW